MCSSCPRGTTILSYAHLIGVEVLDTCMRMYERIALVTAVCWNRPKFLYYRESLSMPMSHCSDVVARYSRSMLPVGARTPLCHASSGSEVVHVLYLCRSSLCNHELQVCTNTGQYSSGRSPSKSAAVPAERLCTAQATPLVCVHAPCCSFHFLSWLPIVWVGSMNF